MPPTIPSRMAIRRAARVLRRGGVIAYPTEGVFGLGCLPTEEQAVRRILDIKQRDPSMGLILIASNAAQLEPFAVLPDEPARLSTDAAHPVTWVLPSTPATPALVRGGHPGVAVRICAHPVAAALCDAVASPLVSTSANRAGQPPVRNDIALRQAFGGLVDYLVPGACGPARGASEIRDFASGTILRHAE